MNALLDDFSMHDSNARLWPQTERLKAALSAALATGAPASTLYHLVGAIMALRRTPRVADLS